MEDLNIWGKKLVQLATRPEGAEVTDKELAERLNANYEWYNKRILETMEQTHQKFEELVQELKKVVNELDLWKRITSYHFSETYKQEDIGLLGKTTAISNSSDSYKFAVLEPSIESSGLKEFKFRMKNLVSSWVAVGMCHRDIVVSKDYRFNYSSTGHGAYMVSSNRGVWSNTRSEHNNKVSAFSFCTDDVVHVKVDLSSKTVKFILNEEEDSWETTFTTIAGDELYPCVLFYFQNDEVECLPID